MILTILYKAIVKRIVEEHPGDLGTINLNGLNRAKYLKVKAGEDKRPIVVRDIGRQRIILDGHHRAAVKDEEGRSVEVIVCESEDEAPDPIIKLNFGRCVKLNDTTTVLGIGNIRSARARFERQNR